MSTSTHNTGEYPFNGFEQEANFSASPDQTINVLCTIVLESPRASCVPTSHKVWFKEDIHVEKEVACKGLNEQIFKYFSSCALNRTSRKLKKHLNLYLHVITHIRVGCVPPTSVATTLSGDGGSLCRMVSVTEGFSLQRGDPLPLWTKWLTHASENITFPQLRFRAVMK